MTGPEVKPVTAGEVDAVQFTQVRNMFTTRRGYDEDEVDDFLDRVAHTIAAQTRELDAAHARIERAERKLIGMSS